MRTFYPRIKPYATHWLEVDELHTLYVEEVGNPEGIPVLFVHGGPGGGCTENDRRFFDPEKYRVVLFDQRGSGRSKPHAELRNNTTRELVADIEKIRGFLNVESWVLFGGSWGSTLSLVYAQTHPQRVLGMVLRGVFLCRPQDIHWFYQEGANHLFPDYWEDYLASIPVEERGDLLHAYHRRLTGDNELERMAAAKSWSVWEGRCASLHPNHELVEHLGSPHTALAMARIEAHYFVHNAFLGDNEIIANIQHLQGIPAVIVHGRYDVVCPVDQAFALSEAWPEARLEIIRDAGHASSEPGTLAALVEAADELVRTLGEAS
ncbi:MAG: prolyl aminopeptidase [Gammaproteobacteria bacterium]|nr:MAG: prolyl aminopeptidase [Gammaproteobacteria bacterium]